MAVRCKNLCSFMTRARVTKGQSARFSLEKPCAALKFDSACPSIDEYNRVCTVAFPTVVDAKHNATFKRSFDEYKNLVGEDLLHGITVGYSYDRVGRCTQYSVNGTPCVEYEYRNGHLTDVIRKDASGNEMYRHRYTGIDCEEKVVESALIHDLGTATVAWDRMGRVSHSITPYWEETISTDGYDKAGNLKEAIVRDSIGDASYRYLYDNLYQLIHEEGVFSDDYSFDSICNRLKKNDASYQVNSLNQLLSESSAIYSYDKNGNCTEITNGDVHLTFFYDALDRLVAVERPNTVRLEYAYDTSHRRLGKKRYVWTDNAWQPSEEIFFIYFGNRDVGAVDEQNESIEFRVLGRGKGAELGASVGIEIDGGVLCPIHDHRGNITALVDTATRQVHETYRYSAFGEEQLFCAAGIECASVRNPWRFASKRSDPETGFVFFGRRYYSSQTGRFLTPDPVGFSDGPNLYAYVHNSPMVLIDPYGLTAMEDVGGAGIEAGMGLGRGFIHPLDTLYENSGRLVGLGHDIYNGDFSKISNASRQDIANFACARIGETIGACAAGYYVAKAIPGLVYGVGTRIVANVVSRGFAKNTCTRMAESRAVIAAEARVVTAGETAVASESASGAMTRIGGSRSLVAENSVQKNVLNEHLRQCEKYGSERVRFLENGRVRYYGPLDAAKKPGEMTGRRMVREWDPKNGLRKTWHETLDGNERIRSVRPEYNDGVKRHFIFHEDGSYGGMR